MGVSTLRLCAALALLPLFALGADAKTIESAYTDLDLERDCTVLSSAESNGEDGDWRNLVCSGYKGYPVFVYYGDSRESLFYGFPPAGAEPRWESFSRFNHTGGKIEWRIERQNDREIPFATIHRWFVADSWNPVKPVEVLVIEKVGQVDRGQGCAVGYVVATENRAANAEARRIADEKARTFRCGIDQPAIGTGIVPLPEIAQR
ncbi:hypothetical protein [Rhodoligotrophos ferricapiens]|uniref:hypothetical protein n=1 Tax=Rhodoligotrophos ferricapiens TaxID=3069264 RepID=UPI00315CECA1